MTKTDAVAATGNSASLRLMGPELKPEAVTALLGVEPNVSYAKGDLFQVGSQRRDQRRRFGAWIFTTEGRVAGGRMEDHVSAIVHLLEGRAADDTLRRVGAMVRETGSELLVSLFWAGASTPSAPRIDPALERLVTSVGGRIEVDVEDADCVA